MVYLERVQKRFCSVAFVAFQLLNTGCSGQGHFVCKSDEAKVKAKTKVLNWRKSSPDQ